MATMPARNECHFTKPNTKSTTAQIEKNTRGVGRFISPALCAFATAFTIPIENHYQSTRERMKFQRAMSAAAEF